MRPKFAEVLKKYSIVLEEAPRSPAANDASKLGNTESAFKKDAGETEQAPEQPKDIQNQPQPVKPLDSAGYVTLVRLLRDAFIAKPSNEDSALVGALQFTGPSGPTTEINETNADEAFNKLLPIISKYSRTDIGVKQMLQTS